MAALSQPVTTIRRNEDPLGQYFTPKFEHTDEPVIARQIIGVVGDTRVDDLWEPYQPQFFMPYGQDPSHQRTIVVMKVAGDPAAYENADTAGVTHQPGFSTAAVHWLIDNRRLDVRGALGTDTFGADLGTDKTFAASTLLYDKHRISLENMNNLASIPETGAYVLVGGPCNKAGSGSPATIFGLVPRQ